MTIYIYILVYVNDIYVTSNDISSVTQLIAYLSEELFIRDLDCLSYFFYIKV
jgi:c-di-GMP-related signal transduction protein